MGSAVQPRRIKFYKQETISIGKIRPNDWNPNSMDARMFAVLIKNIEKEGFIEPVIITKDGVIVNGEHRWRALQQMGEKVISVVRLDMKSTDPRAKLESLSLNNIHGENIEDKLAAVLADLEHVHIDLDLTGFDEAALDDLLRPQSDVNTGALQEHFIVPPFSVLDTRQEYWQARRAQWLDWGISGVEGRHDELTFHQKKPGWFMDALAQRGGRTSVFDPVLTEVMYTWFCPKHGHILDPFAGAITRGAVACKLGHKYTGIEIRKEQIDADLAAAKKLGVQPEYILGDANNINKLCKGKLYDFIFTSPPYYDLEAYSKADMSALPTYEIFREQYRAIVKACYDHARTDTFIAFQVGEIRNTKTGIYRDFVGDTAQAFTDAGYAYYNEFVLINMLGTLPLRAAKQFTQSRKIGHAHQNILVGYKGNPKTIGKKFGPVELPEEDHAE
jgi:16S rRNA G966 N2-methylase RsmD